MADESQEENIVSLKVEEEKKEEAPVQETKNEGVPVKPKEEKASGGDVGGGFIKRPLFWQLTSVLLLILFFVSLLSGFGGGPSGAAVQDIGSGDVKEKVQDYVDTVLQGRFPATLGDVVEEAGLYKIEVSIEGQTIESYVTKDGRLFFPNVVDLELFEELGVVPSITGPPGEVVVPAEVIIGDETDIVEDIEVIFEEESDSSDEVDSAEENDAEDVENDVEPEEGNGEESE